MRREPTPGMTAQGTQVLFFADNKRETSPEVVPCFGFFAIEHVVVVSRNRYWTALMSFALQ